MYKKRAGWLFLSVILCVVGYTLTVNNDSWISKQFHKYSGTGFSPIAKYEIHEETAMNSVEKAPMHPPDQDHDNNTLHVSDTVIKDDENDDKSIFDDLENNKESLTEAQIDNMLNALEIAADSIYDEETFLDILYDAEDSNVASLYSIEEDGSAKDNGSADIDAVIMTKDENKANSDSSSFSTTSSEHRDFDIDTIDDPDRNTSEEKPAVVDDLS